MRALFLLAAAALAAIPSIVSAQSTNIITQQARELRQLSQTGGVFFDAQRRSDTWLYNGALLDPAFSPTNVARRAELGRCILETAPDRAIRFAVGEAGPGPLSAAFKTCGSDGLYGLRSSRLEQRRSAILDAIAAAQAERR